MHRTTAHRDRLVLRNGLPYCCLALQSHGRCLQSIQGLTLYVQAQWYVLYELVPQTKEKRYGSWITVRSCGTAIMHNRSKERYMNELQQDFLRLNSVKGCRVAPVTRVTHRVDDAGRCSNKAMLLVSSRRLCIFAPVARRSCAQPVCLLS